MPRILVSDPLSDRGIEILRREPGFEVEIKTGLKEPELAKILPDFDVLLVRSATKVTASLLERADRLKLIGRAGIGIDNVDVAAASKKGVVVMNTPTGNAVTAAEHALALLLSLARRIPQADASLKRGKWEKQKFVGTEVAGKTIGIVGLGNIGRIVADRARGLNMRVLAYDPVLSPERAVQLGVELGRLDQIWRESDFITLHTPLTPETRGMIDDAVLDQCRTGVLIVNAARGGLIDEAALERALKSGKVGGAALDVFEKEPPGDHPLLKLDNVIATPHLGASTEEAQERVAVEIAQQTVAFLRDGVIQNAVNYPSLSRDRLEKLAPYLDLATRLGSLLAQIDRVQAAEVVVECAGEVAELGATPITQSALAGFLRKFLDVPVNAVSAPTIARDRGIAVQQIRSSQARDFANTVKVIVRGPGGSKEAVGTLFGENEPRLVRLRNYRLDALPVGAILIVENEDQPGVIGAIGTLLGEVGINVSRAQVGLDPAQKIALMLWNIDSPAPEPTLARIRKLSNLRSCVQVTL